MSTPYLPLGIVSAYADAKRGGYTGTYDEFCALLAGIGGLQPKLTAGQNISITGNVIDTKAFPCSPNLLDNWYFGNPVNQRGQTEYTGAGYGIDRWKIQNDTNLTVGDGFCTLNGSWDLRQIIENLPKATYTASILFKNSTANALQIIFGHKTGGDVSVAISHDASGVLAGTVSNIDLSNFIISLSGSGSVDIIAVKLELGSQQTLTHQENGVWVLNEIPDYGEQLRRCQRYFVSLIQDAARYTPMGIGVARSATEMQGKLSIPVQMRALPTISTDAADWLAVNGGNYLTTITGIVVDGISPALANISISGQGFSPGMAYELFVSAGKKCTLSAEL